ncbi:MAG TPA: FAD-dependent oxidoreductase [Nitrososphaeraceae archaeon]|nr:FAD-dependent oxidoreductase [Nitrososphaeraceae archaeon]
MRDFYHIAIIGGGILGASLAYFLTSVSDSKIILIEQEKDVAVHTSSRNTGKVHAPFIYDPVKKKIFAKAASLGYDMWQAYSHYKKILFKQDGVLEVANDQIGIDILHKYMEWGEANGLLREQDFKFLDRNETKAIEPNVRCSSAIYCSKDASVDYGSLTKNLIQDCKSFGCTVLLGHKVKGISHSTINKTLTLILEQGKEKKINAEFVVNAAGGNSVDIAHSLGIAMELTDLHFKGEYWIAPPEYNDLTKMSIYSVPKYPEYPFLDPHWIVRVDGICEVGPNAVPVFGPYAYNLRKNLKYLIPKIFESSRMSGVRKIFFDKKFLFLASNELKSSLSKTTMINRVREFLPHLRASAFTQRGTAGIRSALIDKNGKFLPDTLIIKKDDSLHLLNYNSPGATGALPMAAMLVNRLIEDGLVMPNSSGARKSLWDIQSISAKMQL